ncbi:sigma-70 family RNA polymerase sigma factor [Microbulbifer bruguierae]|uniref:Sigma-70 family RNA polymerase sigma factor n=1 Tax=Microbulbifer bruguierae TaxID=3029061 RepID=A0ABY8N9J4_9GAMM|nr:sigma-70 family RNA polymerase sigma factor [Microbulbifer bruguierae]WGL15548.1 sigma-70 family RNA polymerase sigma factor [Microbulbifer bruguierae]
MSNSFFPQLRLSLFAPRGSDPQGEAQILQLLDQIHTDTRKQLLASLCRMLEPAQAEEVLQEAYLKLLQALREKRAPEPRAFLFRVARNLAISHLRHQKMASQHGGHLQLVMSPEQNHNDVEDQASRDQEQALLISAINALPPKCRQVFVMRKIDGMPHSQISAVLGVSAKTVENHLARGMRLCREHIVQLRNTGRGAECPSQSTLQHEKDQDVAAG